VRLDTGIDELKPATSLCLRCLVCTYGKWPENYPLCPIYQYHRVYTASPGGLIYLVRALANNWIGCTSTVANFAYECSTCEACDICEIIPLMPPHVSPSDVIRFLRYQVTKQGLIPEGIKGVYQQVKKSGDFLESQVSLETPKETKDDHVDTVLFVECFYAEGQRKIYESAIRLLEKMGKAVAIFDNDGGSCGSSLYDLGFWDELNRLVVKRAEQMKKLDGKKVVFIDPHCQEFMVKRYPEIQPEAPKIIGIHFSELLVDAFKNGKLSVKKKQNIRVSYHDPCHLGRGLGIYEAPRDILSFLGVEMIEMERNREDSYCCGAGGRVTGQAFPDFSRWIATQRIKEFRETGADLLITSCPYCKDAFQRALGAEEGNRVKDLIEVAYEWTR